MKCFVMANLALVLGAASTGVLASPIVMDFNAIVAGAGDVAPVGTLYSEDGYQIALQGSNWYDFYAFKPGWQQGRGGNNGTMIMSTALRGSGSMLLTTVITKSDGGNFDLLSIDLGELFKPGDFAFAGVARSYMFEGLLSGGGTVTHTFNVDLIADGAGGVNDLQTMLFDATWTGLSGVRMYAQTATNNYGTYTYFDNIVMQESAVIAAEIPEPTTLGLVVLALLSGAGLGRRQNNSA